MQHSRGRTPDASVLGTDFAPHTGEVHLDALLAADGMFVNAAFYAPGARTHWHVHSGGQLMMVTSGRGVVVTAAGEVQVLEPGDVVHAPAGEVHWHGAAPDCFVTYTSVSLGSTETRDTVAEDDYAACWH